MSYSFPGAVWLYHCTHALSPTAQLCGGYLGIWWCYQMLVFAITDNLIALPLVPPDHFNGYKLLGWYVSRLCEVVPCKLEPVWSYIPGSTAPWSEYIWHDEYRFAFWWNDEIHANHSSAQPMSSTTSCLRGTPYLGRCGTVVALLCHTKSIW